MDEKNMKKIFEVFADENGVEVHPTLKEPNIPDYVDDVTVLTSFVGMISQMIVEKSRGTYDIDPLIKVVCEGIKEAVYDKVNCEKS